jgi:lysophospholipase L1-like esterase
MRLRRRTDRNHRRRECGQGSIEYLGAIVAAAVIGLVLVAAAPALGGQVAGEIRSAVCELAGEGCPGAETAGPDTGTGDTTPGGETPPGDGDGPLPPPPAIYRNLPPEDQQAIREAQQRSEDERQRRRRETLLGVISSLPPAARQSMLDLAMPRYVALGDSYSAGTGTRDYSLDEDCERGPHAYGPRLADERGYQFEFRACGGATTEDVWEDQLDAIDEDTRVITLSIGGNDAGFSSVLTECGKPGVIGWDCPDKIDDAREFINDELPERLDALYDEIQRRAPNAEVVIVGYPELFGDEDCNAGTFFSGGEREDLNETGDMLAEVTREQAEAHDFEFVDGRAVFRGHAVCADQEYINGLSDPKEDSFHPNRDGHAAYAEAITDALED